MFRPEHAHWVELQTEGGRPAGKVLLSVEVLPRRIALTRPVGYGRSEPNDFPFLPPPEGRPDARQVSRSDGDEWWVINNNRCLTANPSLLGNDCIYMGLYSY